MWVANASPEVNAESQYPTIIAICILLSICSISVVSSRLYIRATARGLAGDDWWAAMSMVFALAYSITSIMQTKYGLGLPLKDRPAASLVPYTRVNYAGRPIYQIGIGFFKVALLISYLRLLSGTDNKRYRMIVWATIVLIFLAHLGCALSLIFACTPVNKSWNPLEEGHCLASGPSFTGYAVVTIVSDIIVAILPIPVLLKLNIRTNKKLGLIAIFLLGLFTTVCSIMRYLQINRIQYGDGNSTMLVLWGTIEFNVGNMVSSLPFLAPFCMRKAQEYRSKHSYNNNNNNNDNDNESSGQNSRSRDGVKGGDHNHHIQLSDASNRKSFFGSSARSTDSEENISQGNAILKSVTYTVKRDDDDDDDITVDSKPRRRGDNGEDQV